LTDDEVLKLPFGGWPLPDEYLIEVGRIAANWGLLEAFLNMCLRKLAGFNEQDDPTPLILIVHTSFPQRLDMLGALCEVLLPQHSTLSDYQKVVASLKTAQKLRNRYMHDAMGKDEASGKVNIGSASARGTLKFSNADVKLVDLRRVSMAIHQALLDLYKLVLQRDIPPIWDRDKNWRPE
jgi:hypothetical protein